MTTLRHSEAGFETVIGNHLLGNGYTAVASEGLYRERPISPESVLAFIRATQPRVWVTGEDCP